MPFVYLIMLAVGGIIRLITAAAEEEDKRNAEEAYRARENRLYRERMEQLRQARVPAIPAPQPAAPPVPVNDPNRKSRRFDLRIPLADNQIAMALRPVRAAAMSEHSQISGVTFAAEPGGGAVELIVTLDSGTSIDEAALEHIYRSAESALKSGYRIA
ncbi:MAG: hypothetical protein Q4G64_07385 [bacterium]|nr:hypothetical protein [bacterium]